MAAALFLIFRDPEKIVECTLCVVCEAVFGSEFYVAAEAIRMVFGVSARKPRSGDGGIPEHKGTHPSRLFTHVSA
jgi:hypothetical protein